MNTQLVEDYVGNAIEEVKRIRAIQSGIAPPKRVLIVDDIASDVELLCIKFKSAGCLVDSAMTGDEALKIVTSSIPFKIALVDQNFPTEKGTDIIARLRKVFPGLFIAIISGQVTKELIMQAAQLNCAIFQKDFITDALIEELIK